MSDNELRTRVERLLTGDFRLDDITRLFLYARDRCDGREPVQEIGDFVAHHDERYKGLITKTTRDWFEIARFQGTFFGPSGRHSIDAKKLPPNTPQYLRSTMRRISQSMLKSAGLTRANAYKLIPKIISHLDKNPENTFCLSNRITAPELKLLNVLCSVLVVQPAFDGNRLFSDFSATLRSLSLLRKNDLAQFEKLKIPIGLFALSEMNRCTIGVDPDTKCKLTVHIDGSSKTIGISAAVPLENFPHPKSLSIGSSIFTLSADPAIWCTERLINRQQSVDYGLEVTREGKLDILLL